jgi:hypothetical protein
VSNGINYDSREIIFGLKSKLGRAEERIAVLENLVQGVSDDRDGYMERCVQLDRQLTNVHAVIESGFDRVRDAYCLALRDSEPDQSERFGAYIYAQQIRDVLAGGPDSQTGLAA